MHAVLITAYKDYPSLLRLVRRLDPVFFKPFIHIDKKSRLRVEDIEELQAFGADVISRYVIRWGSFTHLQAILDLMARASGELQFDYLHVISGQDYPLWNAEEFRRRCDGRIFIDYGALEEQPRAVRERYELVDPFHFLLTGAWGSRGLHKFLTRKSHFIRRILSTPRTRFGPYRSLYKALVWSSIPMTAANRLLDDPIATDFLSALRNTRLPEEVYFATYYLNSELAPLVVKDDLRYTDWRERNGSNPAYLDETDADDVLRSKALFARKVNSRCSSKLLDVIDSERFA